MADITPDDVRAAMVRFGQMSVADARAVLHSLTTEERRDIERACRSVRDLLNQVAWEDGQRVLHPLFKLAGGSYG